MVEDSRFSKARLQQNSLDNDSDDSDEDSDASDDDKSVAEKEQEQEEKAGEKSDTNSDHSDEEVENDVEQTTDTQNAAVTDSEEEDEMEEHEGYDAPEDLTEFGVHGNDEASKKSNKRNKTSKKKMKALTPEELEKFEKARKRTGVCYLSRIPPFMPPHRVRQLLEKYAEIGRIYLVPEDAKTTARRKKYTKNRRTNFVEGWVEFKDKKKAKALAEYLNMRQIGGKRKNQYYHEMWNIKYLPKFKWHHLTEQMAHEKQARQQRLRNEIAQANRENKTYIENVQRAKMLQSMEAKKRKREGNEGDDNQPTEIKVKRTFAQRGKVEREVDPSSSVSGKQAMDKLDNGLKNVLSNVFGKH
ncbi:hypothetical protein BDF20DRAFT_815925 [Mycotypha africana]|uniref:uncharacterized protein n=1 Tax=Mycotypha africana TaxID=64632 RepID=UPI002300BD4F|nr:uncharacterized protein BDF20DRAFT_815925 [Mycotypha africana]KAI8984746.1 hypothetical protein BDF20DRAFT_815925 [Mycotypha africana]